MTKNIDKLSILVVENPSPTRDLMETVLSSVESNTLYVARNGEHALTLSQARTHDLIIVDLDIKPGGGIEFVKKIQKQDTNNTPIILMATHASNDTIEDARELGINDLLIKPFSFDDLIKHINHVTDKNATNNKRAADHG